MWILGKRTETHNDIKPRISIKCSQLIQGQRRLEAKKHGREHRHGKYMNGKGDGH